MGDLTSAIVSSSSDRQYQQQHSSGLLLQMHRDNNGSRSTPMHEHRPAWSLACFRRSPGGRVAGAVYELVASAVFTTLCALVRAHSGIADEILALAFAAITLLLSTNVDRIVGIPASLVVETLAQRKGLVNALIAGPCQLIGAFIGAFVAWVILPTALLANAATVPSNGYSRWAALCYEIVGMLVFMVAYGRVINMPAATPMRAGYMVVPTALASWIAYPVTRTSLNIWYQIAISSFSVQWSGWWIYWCGDVIAFAIYICLVVLVGVGAKTVNAQPKKITQTP